MPIHLTSVKHLDLEPKHDVFPSPRDWRDVFLYQLLVDRFDDGADHPAYDPAKARRGRDQANSYRFQGGKLKGITRRLDYIKGLGVYVAEQSGSDWRPIAGGDALNANPVAAGRAQFVNLVRDEKGRLLAAWQEQKAGYNGENATPERVHVRRLEGGKWVELGRELPAASPQSRSLGLAMCVHQGEPVAAICEGTDGGRASLIVYAWDGNQWNRLGPGPLNVFGPEGGALKPALVSDGKSVWVAWPEFLPGRPPLLFVKQWDGQSWRLVGGPLNEQPGRGAVHHPVLAILAGKPVVAWTEHDFEGDALRRLFVKAMK